MPETLQITSLAMVALYSFVAAITPGPNNIMLLSSGLTFGMRRTVPHMAGILAGFLVLTTVIVIGVGAAVMAVPAFRYALLAGGTAFMVYLAYKTMTASSDLKQREAKRPLTFSEAAAFQAINPKAWGFGLSYMALVIGVSPGEVVTFWIAVYAILIPQISTAISALSWAGLGQVMTQLIDSPRTVRLINILLGLTLFLMIPLMFWSELREILAL
jgi:threonine/homoserine/homoserine lactone efflux protein